MNYGLKFDEKDPNAYQFGASILPELVLQDDGQWDNYLPTYEPQFNSYFDTYGCTVWGTQNVIETMLKKIEGVEYNFSERFTYILAKIVPPGADPHHVAEIIRNNGLIDNDLLPMTSSQKREDFLRPNPMTKELLDKGLQFGYEVKHEYVWQSPISVADRTERIKKALRLSPLGVSVTAWIEKNGIYVDDGKPNTHWCVLFGWNTKGWKIFDSYDQSIKTLAFDHNMQVGKRYHLQKSTRLPQIGIIQTLLVLLQKLLGLTKEEPVIAPTPVVSKLIPWAKAIEIYEGANKAWNNPGAIRGTNGAFLKFPTYQEGFDYLCNYLTRAATGKHKAYPKGGESTLLEFQRIYSPANDNNNPDLYAKFVANRLGITVDEKIKNLV